MNNQNLHPVSDNPPAFNIPAAVVFLACGFVAVHAGLLWLASDNQYQWVIAYFSFIPRAYEFSSESSLWSASLYWRPVSYSFLHGDWTHVLVNTVWLIAFGSPVARRFGLMWFGLFFVASSCVGIGLHYLLYSQSPAPVIGASAVVSGCMGAAIRFAFQPRQVRQLEQYEQPALSLIGSLANKNIMIFVIIWFGINWLFGSGVVPVTGVNASVAWEAHIGGFLTGFLGFSLFDRKTLNSLDRAD